MILEKETDKTNKVIGLAYKPGEGLPRVVVKGHGEIADEIIKAKRLGSGPRVIKNKELVDLQVQHLWHWIKQEKKNNNLILIIYLIKLILKLKLKN